MTAAATVPGLVADAALRHPDLGALVVDDERHTTGALARDIARRAAELEELGVGPGSRVAIVLGNSMEFFTALFGVLACGAVAVPLSTRAPEPELDALVAQARAGFVIGGQGVRTTGARPESVPDDAAVVLFTSGTTSRPKGVVLTHRALTGMARGMAEHRFGLTTDDVMWAPLPVNHVGPITLFLACLHAGARFLTMARLDGEAALDLIERERATVLIPNFIAVTRKLLEAPSFSRRDLSSVRVVNSVGTFVDQQTVQRAFPGAVQTSTFGMTETCGAVTITPFDDSDDLRSRSVGYPQPGIEIRIVEPGTDAPVDGGLPGEIQVGGFNVMAGYLDDPEATAVALTSDGYFRTGDLGRLEADGRLEYLGRLRSTIKVGGENVAPAEVEEVLGAHPGVAEVHVVGTPDDRLGEVVVAFVECSAAVREDALIEYCRERLSRFRVPRRIVFVTEWPQSETKVDLAALRRMAAGEEVER